MNQKIEKSGNKIKQIIKIEIKYLSKRWGGNIEISIKDI